MQALAAEIAAAERHTAAAVRLAREVARDGVAERVAGQPLEGALAMLCRQAGADRATMLAAGDVLDDMPCLRGWFAAGRVSWGEVRAVTRALAKRSRADRHAVDARLAATFPDGDGLDRTEPDELIGAAQAAVADCRQAADVQRDEADGIQSSFLAVQRDVFGGARVYGEWDATTAAGILATLDVASPTPTRPDHDRAARDTADADSDGADGAGVDGAGVDSDHGDGGGDGAGAGECDGQPSRSGWSPPPRSRDYAAALSRVCGEWLAGHTAHPATLPPASDGTGDGLVAAAAHVADDAGVDGTAAGGSAGTVGGPAGTAGEAGGPTGAGPVTGRRARPLLTATVDVATATAAMAGHLDLPARGPLPQLTAAAIEALMCDADVRAVVFDGARPLATTTTIQVADIPAATRRAVEARDQGCRWHGCQTPLAHTDLHHLVERARGGTHHPENLACLCRGHHVTAHRHGWTLTLDGTIGVLTGHWRQRRRWATRPRGTTLTHPTSPTDHTNADAATAEAAHGGDTAAERDPPNDRPPGDEPAGGDPAGGDPPAGWGQLTDHDGNPLPF